LFCPLPFPSVPVRLARQYPSTPTLTISIRIITGTSRRGRRIRKLLLYPSELRPLTRIG